MFMCLETSHWLSFEGMTKVSLFISEKGKRNRTYITMEYLFVAFNQTYLK